MRHPDAGGFGETCKNAFGIFSIVDLNCSKYTGAAFFTRSISAIVFSVNSWVILGPRESSEMYFFTSSLVFPYLVAKMVIVSAA